MSDIKISCVMPTYNRREFIKAAIKSYQQQTYANRELVILDDGTDSVEAIVPSDPTIHYHRVLGKMTTGDKRNMVNSMTTGEIIAHYDDDDWFDPYRLEHQYSLLKDGTHTLTGYRTAFFWSINTLRAYYVKYLSPANCVYGCTITYWKSYWESNHFEPSRTGSDFKFVMDTIDTVACSHETKYTVSRIHNTNVSNKPRYPLDSSLLPAKFWDNEKYRLENL